MSNLTRRQFLLTTTAAAAATVQLPPVAEAGFGLFRGGTATSSPPSSGTIAAVGRLVADVRKRAYYVYSSTPQAPNVYYSNTGNGNWNQTDGTFLTYAVQSTLAASSFPTTMSLVQDGSLAGGVPTNSFGWVFRPGDIPKGHAPLFQVADVTWGYSAGLQTYWPDGSLKWAAFSLMVPNGFAPSINVRTDVTISDGGFRTWPAASGRTLTEVYNQGLVINAKTPSPAIPSNGRSADLYAVLANDGNNYYAIKDMDGAAGARWRIKTKFTATPGSTMATDPRMIGDHYIFAMNNASGELGGFRWFGAMRDPLRGDQVGADTEWTAFQPPSSASPSTGYNWSINPGSGGTVYTPVQHPFNTVNFNNGFSCTGFIDDGSGNGTPSGIAGPVLTVSSVPSGFTMAATTVTASAPGAGSNRITITEFDSPFSILFGFSQTVGVAPPGSGLSGSGPGHGLFGFASQISSLEPDGSFGRRGTYAMNNIAFNNAFTDQRIILSSHLPLGNYIFSTGRNSTGLWDGSTQTGQNFVQGQLTATDGDGPGQRGTYLLAYSGLGPNNLPTIVTSRTMNYFSTYVVQTDMPLNWYSGASQGNRMVAICTGSGLPPQNSGALPRDAPFSTGLDGGCLSFYGVFSGQNASIWANDINCWTAPGSGTLTPIPAFARYTRFQLANADGKYWFFQGTGSIAADSTLRVQINQAYWQSTGCFPPMDMSLMGTVPDTGYRYDWNPYNACVCRSVDVDGGGPPYEVGLMNSTAAIDFYAQTFHTEKENRIFGLYAGTLAADWTDSNSATLDPIPPSYGTGTPYAGLPAALMGVIAPERGGIASSLYNTTHEPDFAYWAYLQFGELQYLDYMVGWANIGQQQWDGGGALASVMPYITYGSVVVQGQNRGVGWANRDVQKIAFIYSYDPSPDAGTNGNPVFSDGTQLVQYLIDRADDQPRMVLAMCNSTNPTLYGTQASADYLNANPGAWTSMIGSPPFPGSTSGAQEWEMAYIYGGMMLAALRGNADATAVISNWINWMDHMIFHTILAGDYGGNGFPHFLQVGCDAWFFRIGIGPTGSYGNAWLTNDTQFSGVGSTFYGGSHITQWVPNTGGGSAFTMSGNLAQPWYNQNLRVPPPQNNDAIRCQSALGLTPTNNGSQWPPELTLNTLYYVRDISPSGSSSGPWTFNLAATKGGPAIAISSTNMSPQMMDLGYAYISSNPDQINAFGPDYLWQVSIPHFWVSAIGANAKLNAFARFT